jgi:alpha-tubulin suppressor-like RCC1 family protein
MHNKIMKILPPILNKLFPFSGTFSFSRIFLFFGIAIPFSLFGNVAYHSLILKSDGSLHTFGSNSYGQLGDGTTTNKTTPTQILASGVSQIAAGLYHSMILKSDGSLHTFGYNSNGQLGDGTITNKTTPTQILASGVSQITAGQYHSLILKSDGSLHTFGSNSNGQLGDGTTTQRNIPTQILASGVSQIAAGQHHSLILKSDGSLHTFGMNTNGQLGDGTTTQRNIPTQILASGVAQIAAGTSHSLILKSDGSLHSFGYNNYGQLGDGSTTQRNTPTQILASGVSQIAAGFYHSLILKSDGSLHTFGYNNQGQLGDGTNNNRTTPTQILASGVSQIAAGRYHSLILKSDGSLHTFGYNNYGQLGDGTTTQRNTPTQILASGVARLSEQPVPFAETFTVSGGQSTAPYYDFNDSQGNTPDMTSFIFHKGSRYLFTANNISGSHPFMIGTSRGVSSPIVNGGPLNSAGNGHQIIVDIPQDFNSTLVYYCTNHTTMSQSMNVASPSGGFVPVYNLNASQLTSLVNSSNIVAGNYKVVEEMNASNQLELRIRPVVQTNGSWVDFGANQFYRTNSSYPTLSSVLNYITSNNINAVNAPTGDTISITSPTSGSTVLENNDNLHVYINYQSNGGGYQTPTWAYRIDSGFPGYGSPHGGTQVTGTSTKSNFLSGQSYGSKTVHVALLDQSGNLHNPPITLNRTLNYQSSGGGYSSPGGGYSSPGSGYSSPGSGYSSPGNGYSSPPIYETTATLLVNNQPTSITGIPRAGPGNTWYQSFTAENSAKLTKFAFVTNGSFSATADVKIREGEGITGNILHSGTWSGLGSNANNFNEYEITNEVLLASGQKYTIQLENQTAGGFIGSNPGQYNGGMFYYSGYSGEYGDLKMKIWGLLEATGDAIEIISPATNDQNVTDNNDTLTISYNYQSNAGGYQTPTWAYRIDSGFPGYGSPHGGTQVTGSRIKNNFLSGQTYGSKTVYVALLDQSGNLHNPPITLNRTLNYQSSGGGYSSPGGGYSSPGSGYSSPGSGYSSPGNGYSSPGGGYTSPGSGYSSPGNGYSSPGGGYSSPGNGYSSPGGGYTSPGSGYSSPGNGYSSPGGGYSSPGNGYSSPGGGYTSPGSGYSSPGNGYSSPGGGYSSPGNGYSSPGGGYTSPGSGYSSPGNGYSSPGGGYSSPGNGYSSPGGGYTSPGSGYSSPGNGYSSPGGGYSSPGNGYSSPGGGYTSPGSGYSSPGNGYEPAPVSLAYVITIGHKSEQEGIRLSGEILGESDTNYDNIMVGFLLSTNIDLSLNDPFTQKIIGEFNNEGLFTGNFISTMDDVIYYKAFAENEMGNSYGKVNKIAVIKSTYSQGQSPSEKAISTLGEDSIELLGGWSDNSWFGLYKSYENGWIYHSAHGWLYLSADNSDGIWAWSENRSWVWSSKEIYPFLYQPSIGNWIYFLNSKNGNVYFFNYSTNLVEVNIP